jgi:hypothetical protein
VQAAAADQRVFDQLVELGLGSGTLAPGQITGIARRLPRWGYGAPRAEPESVAPGR